MPVYLPGLTFGGLGYGGASYGYSPYGSGVSPRLEVPVDGGYGGAQYGYNSYGSIDIIPPKVTGANALDGFRVEVFFSEEMQDNSNLTNPGNYSFTDAFGVPLTSVSVAQGTPGTQGGYTSVIVTHTGSTLGGQYDVAVINVQDLANNNLLPSSAPFAAFGDPTTVLVSLPLPDDGRTVRLDFRDTRGLPQDLLTEAQFSPGVEDVSSYEISTTYPVPPTLSDPTQNPSTLSQVDLDVHPMTSTLYDFIVGPSLAYDYDGSVLPDDDTTLTGVEVGTGTSTATLTDGLLLAKALGVTYGWQLRDDTGRLIPGSSFRADFTIDTTAAAISPIVLNSTLATLSVSDGGVQVDLTLEDVAGSKAIGVSSGALSVTLPADWSSAEFTITLIRNQQADFYTVLFNGVPILTVPLTDPTGAPTFPAGTQVLLGASHQVSLFKVKQVEVTSSSTLFTSTWNFIHNLQAPFTGSAVLTRDRILTKKGPLVRGWGDNTPAVKEDVEVRVNSTVVDIASINPYVGEIYPTIPIPLSTPGTVSVEIDYIWFSNPPFALAGLNTRGLGLNIWDRAVGHTAGSISPTPSTSVGAMAGNRFPMGIVLGPLERESPKQIGHRYIGFQKGYSALLNEPTTLLLNQDPHRISIGNVSAEAFLANGSFDGQTAPAAAETPWTLDGVDNGGLVGDGTWRLSDDSTGPYGVGTATIYRRELDLSLPTTIAQSARFFVESYSADGVFTGAGFGMHDGGNLLLVGALLVDGVQHVGVLLDGANPHLEESWQIGPGATATATSQTTLEIPFTDFPSGVGAGSRFRVGSGPQAGIYTIEECGLSLSPDGNTIELTVTPELPADVEEFGNDQFEILFETPWDTDLITLRVLGEWPTGGITVTLGGAISGEVATLTELISYPAQTALLLPATKEGVAFWGSLSRRAENTSIWDLTQYSSTPEQVLQTVQGLTVQTEMNVLPPDDPNDPWYIAEEFGYGQVDGSGDYTLIKATSAGTDSLNLSFGYTRVEPFLSPKVTTDLEAKFKVESGYLGALNTSIIVGDGQREVIFTPLLYTQSLSGRALVLDLPQASLSGLQDPVTAGWVKSTGNTVPGPFVRGQTLEFQKASGEEGTWYKTLTDPVTVLYQGLISEARLEVASGTSGSLGIGPQFGCRVTIASNTVRQVGLTWDTSTVSLVDSTGATVATFAFSWDGGQPHTYRLLCDPTANIVVLVIDDEVIGNAALSSFASASGSPAAFIGALGDGVASWVLHSTSAIPLRPVALSGSVLGRTFGILLREGEPDSIDGYRIPRADSTDAANSSLSAIPVQMDWQAFAHVRLLLDPSWGVSFYRPDLPLPPWATGNFVTETTDPTAAWATVEYAELPVRVGARGCVTFGSPEPAAITQSRWDFMRYRIRGHYAGFGVAPQNMVLNRAFTFNSGEWNYDVTPEVRTVLSRTSTLVNVGDSAIYADRLFVVQVDGTVLPSTGWAFDKATQNLILTSALPEAQYPVTITFAAARPVTQEYLCSQPIEGSVTLLNEGTPPVPKSRDQASSTLVVSGSRINDPNDVLDDAESLILNDPYEFVEFTDGEDSLYACTSFCEVEVGDDVHLSTLCDGPGIGQGLAEIAIEGQFTSDALSLTEGPAGPWGSQSPFVGGSASKFNQMQTLFVSGGSYTDGVLGGGVAPTNGTSTPVMYPNGRGPDWAPLPLGSRFGFNQDVLFIIEDVTVREELFELSTLMGDNVPPSSADPATDPNPDGTPGTTGNGAAAYILEDFAPSTFSRLGRWGTGTTFLEVRSLLAGGAPLDGTEFVLQGGSPLPLISTVTSGAIEAAN